MDVPPGKLYKYLASARVDVLKNLQIRFTQPSELNDPFEFNLLFNEAISTQQLRDHYEEADKKELILDAISKLPPDQKALLSLFPQERLFEIFEKLTSSLINSDEINVFHKNHVSPVTPKLKESISTGLNKTIGILSLSATPLSPPMWANYAENSTGFVLEFDTTHAFFNSRRSEKDEFYHLRQVIYEDRQPSATLMEMQFDTFVLKNKSWEYEREWRMLLPLATASKKFTTAAGDDVSLFDFPAKAISKVIIGLHTKEETISELVEVLSTSGEYAHISLARIQKGPTGFELIAFENG